MAGARPFWKDVREGGRLPTNPGAAAGGTRPCLAIDRAIFSRCPPRVPPRTPLKSGPPIATVGPRKRLSAPHVVPLLDCTGAQHPRHFPTPRPPPLSFFHPCAREGGRGHAHRWVVAPAIQPGLAIILGDSVAGTRLFWKDMRGAGRLPTPLRSCRTLGITGRGYFLHPCADWDLLPWYRSRLRT